jgi:hypothetical protein
MKVRPVSLAAILLVMAGTFRIQSINTEIARKVRIEMFSLRRGSA